MREQIVLSDCVGQLAFFFTFASLPTAGHRSYMENKHVGMHDPDEDDLKTIPSFCRLSRRRVLSLRFGGNPRIPIQFFGATYLG